MHDWDKRSSAPDDVPSDGADVPEFPDTYRNFMPKMAPQLAQGILAAVFCAIGLSAFFSVLSNNVGFQHVALSVLYLGAVLGLQLGYFSRPKMQYRPAITCLALLVQAGLVYAPLLQFGDSWVGLPGYLAGSVLLTLPPRAGIPAAAAVVVSMGVLGFAYGYPPVPAAHLVISATITCLVVYGLTRLVRLVAGLHAARGELARLAVTEERFRVSRDVHDLLGLSLSAITLKSELADRLITDNPERARTEIAEIVGMSRQALADARQVANGSRELRLDDECRSARAILTAADVEVTIVREDSRLPSEVSTVLATVLREGVTNVLRHSKAEQCQIIFGTHHGAVRMEIINDGAGLLSVGNGGGGNGLRNLSHRTQALGGSLTAVQEPRETFRLRVDIPLENDEE